MTDYNSTSYLVRILYKEDGAGITMDSTNNPHMQEQIKTAVTDLVYEIVKEFEITKPKDGTFFEVMVGATANQISRREDLLNAARNLLIECEAMIGSKQMEKVILNLIDEIGEEIGVAQ